MSLARLLRVGADTALASSRLWLHPLSALLASAIVLAFALVGERQTILEIAAQLRATSLSAEFIDLLADAQRRLTTVAVVLIPVMLALGLFWLDRLAHTVLHVQRLAAPGLALPRRRRALLPALARLGVTLLAIGGIAAVLASRPTTAAGLLGWMGGLLLFGCIAMLAIALVAVLRPTLPQLLKQLGMLIAGSPGTFVGLLIITALLGVVALALLGFPLYFALKLHAYGAALLAGGAVLVLAFPLFLLAVVWWSIFALAGLERQAARRAATSPRAHAA